MSYSFRTDAGKARSVSIPSPVELSGYVLTAEFSQYSDFQTIAFSKGVVGSAKVISLSLTVAEVDSLKDVYYRIRGVNSGRTSTIQNGRVDYVEAAATSATPAPGTVSALPTTFPWRNGSWYAPAGPLNAGTLSTTTRLVLMPLWVPQAVSISNVAFEVTTGQAASTYQPAIYRDASGWPDTLLWSGSVVDTSTVGVKEQTATGLTLPQGWVWIGGLFLGATSPTFRCNQPNLYSVPTMGTSPSGTLTNNTPAFTGASVSTLPATYAPVYGSISGSNCVRVVLRSAGPPLA